MTEPLESWNDYVIEGEKLSNKQEIIEFVEGVNGVTKPDGNNYVDPKDRIAVFDNDGTLWSERPIYFQGYFIASNLPPGAEPIEKKAPLTKEDILRMDAESFPQSTTEDYTRAAKSFILNTNYTDCIHVDDDDHYNYDKFTGYKFVDMIYEPVIQLVKYLQDNEFKVYICSGGGRDFVRSFAQEAYVIPPENVIGSSVVTSYDPEQGSGGDVVRTKFQENDGENQVDHGMGQYNDKEGKPVGIQRQIGKRPILACGNSTGDLQMFDYTDQGEGKSLIVLINHDDEVREFKYNDTEDWGSITDSATGDNYQVEPDNASLIKANKPENPHWRVVSMKEDFIKIFARENS